MTCCVRLILVYTSCTAMHSGPIWGWSYGNFWSIFVVTNLRMGNSLPYSLFTRNLIGLFSNPLLVLLRLHLLRHRLHLLRHLHHLFCRQDPGLGQEGVLMLILPIIEKITRGVAAAQSFTSSSWEGERVGITLRQVNTSGLWLQRYLKYNLII